MISNVKFGAVFLNTSEDASLNMIASWPENHSDAMHKKAYEIAKNTLHNKPSVNSKITCKLENEDKVYDVVTLPIRHLGKIIGSVVFIQDIRSIEQKKAVFQLFQWACVWLETNISASIQEKNKHHTTILSVTKLLLLQNPMGVSSNEICTFLAKEFSCTRVSVGVMKNLQVKIIGISDQVRFNSLSPQIREIEVGMQEGIDKGELFLKAKSSIIPFKLSSNSSGAFSFIRDIPFTQDELDIIQASIDIIAPILGLKSEVEQSIFSTLRVRSKKFISLLLGNEHFGVKISAISIIIFFLLLNIIKMDNHVYAKSSLEGATIQVIVSPYETYIKSSHFRAGDEVSAGEKLVVLDDTELLLEKDSLESEHSKTIKEYQESLGTREKAKMSISLAKISQINAKLELLKGKLKRVNMEVPFDGIIISGDLSKSIGAPVQKGQELFEIAPLGNYKVALNVDDYDIKKLSVGQQGDLRLVALPYEQISIVISKITPVSVAKDKGNYFRVEATLLDAAHIKLQPGMQGIAKIKIDERSIFWIWTHTLFERLSLWLWSIGF